MKVGTVTPNKEIVIISILKKIFSPRYLQISAFVYISTMVEM